MGIVKDKSARVMLELEKDYKILDPAATNLVRDVSAGLVDTKLFLEAAFRSAPMTKRKHLEHFLLILNRWGIPTGAIL